ncbi:uncharacterized protein [Medicago truncatula]|uniref:uncharacterized protein n=1 Tax=Medicago truncatula TaxID=3880 RepID=UPI000D2F1E41|nr:uncharacterized protein LOC112417963 [Medicago truncatula]
MQQSCSIFQNLSTFSMDLDLNHIEEVMDLSFALRLCTSLQVLDITLPACGCKDSGDCSSNDNCVLPFERLELCDTIDQKLKFVCIRGFRGKEKEVQFAKYLITRATMMKTITIICNDLTEVGANLLSVPRAFGDLCINLKLNANNNM